MQIIDFLTGRSAEADALRRHCLFLIVPMLNPDGVICGNYRCSLAAVDLNRRWARPSAKLHPTIHALKKLLLRLHVRQPIAMFVDLHGHSRKQRVFMYGCDESITAAAAAGGYGPTIGLNGKLGRVPALLQQVFPLLCSRTCTTTKRETGGQGSDNFFSFSSCSYIIKKSKESTGRVVVHRELQLLTSYTMEASFCGCDDRRRARAAEVDSDDDDDEAPVTAPEPAPASAPASAPADESARDSAKPTGGGFHFSTAHLQQIGSRFCRALHGYFGLGAPPTAEEAARIDKAAIDAIEGVKALPSNLAIHQTLIDLMSGEFDAGADGDTEGSDGGEGSDDESKKLAASIENGGTAPVATGAAPPADGTKLRVAAPPNGGGAPAYVTKAVPTPSPTNKDKIDKVARNAISTRRTREQEMRAAAQRAEAAAAAAAALLGHRPDLLGGATLPLPRPLVGLAAHHFAAREQFGRDDLRGSTQGAAALQQQPHLQNLHSIGFQQQPHLQPQLPQPPQPSSGFQQQPTATAAPPHMQYVSTFQQQPQQPQQPPPPQPQVLQQQQMPQPHLLLLQQQQIQMQLQIQQQLLQSAAANAALRPPIDRSQPATDTDTGYEGESGYDGDDGVDGAISRGASYERGRGFAGKSISVRSQPATAVSTQWAMRGGRPPVGTSTVPSPALAPGAQAALALAQSGTARPERISSGSEARRPMAGVPIATSGAASGASPAPGSAVSGSAVSGSAGTPTVAPPGLSQFAQPGGGGALLKRRAQLPTGLGQESDDGLGGAFGILGLGSVTNGGVILGGVTNGGVINGLGVINGGTVSRSTPFTELLARRGCDSSGVLASSALGAGAAAGLPANLPPGCMHADASPEPGAVAGLELLTVHMRRYGDLGGSPYGAGEGTSGADGAASAAHTHSGIGHARSESLPAARRRAHPPSAHASALGQAAAAIDGGLAILGSSHQDEVIAAEVDDAMHSFARSRRALSGVVTGGDGAEDDPPVHMGYPAVGISDEASAPLEASLPLYACDGTFSKGASLSASLGGSLGGSRGGSGRPGSGCGRARPGSLGVGGGGACGVLVGSAPPACASVVGATSATAMCGRRYAGGTPGLSQTLPVKPPAHDSVGSIGPGASMAGAPGASPGAAPSASLLGNGSWPRSGLSRPRTGEAVPGGRPLDVRSNPAQNRRTAY